MTNITSEGNDLFKIPKKKRRNKEQKLQTAISDYMKIQYPDTDFFCDVAAGLQLAMGMRVLVKRWRSRPGLPDMYIFASRGNYKMLMLELKTESASLTKKDGSLRKNEHLEKQNEVHRRMVERGYAATFVQGFDHAKAMIDWYMKGAEGDPPAYKKRDRDINIFRM